MNKNCFLRGVMVGKMLKARNAGAAVPVEVSAPSSAADYDKSSFLAGLAVGMSTRGALRWPSVASIIYTRESSTDEMLMELYLLDKQGALSVPKLPGMTRLQAWMDDNGFTNISQYATAKDAFKSTIAWTFYRQEIVEMAYDDSTDYPVDMSNSIRGPERYQFDKQAWFYVSNISTLTAALSKSPTIEKTSNKISATYTTTDNATYCSNIAGNGGAIYYADNFPLGKYRLTFISATISPKPDRAENLDPAIFMYVKNHSIEVRPGESQEIIIDSFDELIDIGADSKPLYHQLALHFWFSKFLGSQTISVATNTSYTYSFEFKLELIEKFPYSSDDNAILTDVLDVADSSQLYYLSNDSGETLKPMLMIDQNKQFIRDRDKVRILGGKVSPDIKYPADNIVQINGEMSIDVEGSTANDEYIYTFTEASGLDTVETTMPIESVRYEFGVGIAVRIYGSEIGAKGSKPSNINIFTVRRRELS